jgi:hypothetical protein
MKVALVKWWNLGVLAKFSVALLILAPMTMFLAGSVNRILDFGFLSPVT